MKHVVTWMRTLLCAALVAVLVAASMPALAVGQSTTLATSGSRYIVTASGLNVRSGAGMGFSVITVAPRGATVTYISNNRGWWYVRLSSGTTGYVDKQYLTPVSAADTGAYTVTASVLLMRAKPNTDGKRVGKLMKGTNVYVSKLNGDWGYVSYNGVSGWVALRYLRATSGEVKPASKISAGSVYTVIAEALNVRRSGSTHATRLDTITGGTSVRVSQVSGNWAYVTYTKNGKVRQGWVSTSYLG
ncbi:MAG: SH3 domain-containing protein [Clostridia bacterium]|nr:SH3 domain-containing protein [Clostridia bacterium]